MRRGRTIARLAAAAISLSTTALLLAPAVASAAPSVDLSAADRCDFIGQQAGSACLLPFPDDYYTVADPRTPTGRRVALKTAAMPANVERRPRRRRAVQRQRRVQPGRGDRRQGPRPRHEGGARRTGAAPINHIGRYREAKQPIVVIDAETGKRWPIWSEVDSNATAPPGRRC